MAFTVLRMNVEWDNINISMKFYIPLSTFQFVETQCQMFINFVGIFAVLRMNMEIWIHFFLQMLSARIIPAGCKIAFRDLMLSLKIQCLLFH